MDDTYVYLIGAAIVVILIIVLNHKRQKNKMDNFLQGAEDLQPIFLVKAVEKKISSLSAILYENGVRPGISAGPQVNKDSRKQLLIQELEQLEKEYNSKKISLRAYDDKLFHLLNKANKLAVANGA